MRLIAINRLKALNISVN